ncbi:prepilin-type N-terminal cleavage/methylation domain-containing protein [Steroidobacter cummioxidans]|uniref:prepilin-type N-terminal cleavage/methylation domain-containing protein n=1 Tax=Steroidobacter cummioxidans TaxID=1803913 RepID=UPI0019D43D2C|nr:prepilin-type N-terminal cleavage/methylation domain-containing protein [Steroidobacter cummioxidans]
MVAMTAAGPKRLSQYGTSMIEVLITVVILAIGLLGLAGLQSRLGVSQVESYQRTQALMLLQDMSSRLATNRAHAASYVTGTTNPLADGGVCPLLAGTRAEIDANQWCNALLGAAEIEGGSKAGAMIGARGCVEALSSNEYLITVAWQGIAPVASPPASLGCGQGAYDDAQCPGDLCRRAVTTLVRIADLK